MATKTKVAVIRMGGYPMGTPAPCYLNCPCGAQPMVAADRSDTVCGCGATYDASGWVVRG